MKRVCVCTEILFFFRFFFFLFHVKNGSVRPDGYRRVCSTSAIRRVIDRTVLYDSSLVHCICARARRTDRRVTVSFCSGPSFSRACNNARVYSACNIGTLYAAETRCIFFLSILTCAFCVGIIIRFFFPRAPFRPCDFVHSRWSG